MRDAADLYSVGAVLAKKSGSGISQLGRANKGPVATRGMCNTSGRTVSANAANHNCSWALAAADDGSAMVTTVRPSAAIDGAEHMLNNSTMLQAVVPARCQPIVQRPDLARH